VNGTPAEAGFFVPAEWDKHEGTWLQWPHDCTPAGDPMRLEHIWLAMTEALHRHEMVHVVVPDERGRDHVARQFRFYGFDERALDVHVISTDDVWARDNGPIFVVDGEGQLAITDWDFNGWGGRFPYELDRQVPAQIGELLSVPVFQAPMVLEGGGIEVNGRGTLLATRTSIINENRNPGKSQEEIEQTLRDYLGLKHIIWLSGAPGDLCDAMGDDTDFHIDGAARFVDESTVLYTAPNDTSDPFYPYLARHVEELEQAVTESGASLTLVPLPNPERGLFSTIDERSARRYEGQPVPALYANYYVANGVVLVPVYGDANDARAKSIIAEHFPGREIVGIHAQHVAELGGMMHCVTQQQPAV